MNYNKQYPCCNWKFYDWNKELQQWDLQQDLLVD